MAFVPPTLPMKPCKLPRTLKSKPTPAFEMSISRRSALHKIALLTASAALPYFSSQPGLAAMYSADTTPQYTTNGDPKKLSTYMPQIEAGYETLKNLRDNWEAKTGAYDGDVVRRDLGTVGVKSPLFSIRKTFLNAWKLIAESSPDEELIERLESEWNDVLDKISSVDFQLYSVGFTELRETKEALVTQGRASLDSLLSVYSDMLNDFKSAMS